MPSQVSLILNTKSEKHECFQEFVIFPQAKLDLIDSCEKSVSVYFS